MEQEQDCVFKRNSHLFIAEIHHQAVFNTVVGLWIIYELVFVNLL